MATPFRAPGPMTAPRSWNLLARALVAALAVALAAALVGAQAASARRNVDLEAPSESGQAPATAPEPEAPGEKGPPSSPEAPAGETPGGGTGRHGERHGRRSSCVVTLEAPAKVGAGEAPTLSGKLTCDEAGEAAGASVEILERSAGMPGFATAATALSEPDGSWSVALPPLDSGAFVYARYGRARSPRETIRVAPLVTLAGPAHGAVLPMSRRRSRQTPVTFSGTVSPSDAGAVVALPRERPVGSGTWRRVALTRVGADGSFSFSRLFRNPGPLALRAFVHPNRHRLAAVSETLDYEVAQPQNPSLTISLSPTSVAYGSPATVAGKLAGAAAGTPVTLLARSGSSSFASVASATTEAGGAYTFTQTPERDTVYRVTAGSERSSNARVQVFAAVSAVPSASTVAAGEGLTIAGTVAPASPGVRVYLQRARSAAGWDVLGYATVQPDSTYAIAVPAAEPGSAVYRVSIARTAAAHGAASAPVTVVTTPAGE